MYKKTNWTEQTPINTTNLQKIEDGIASINFEQKIVVSTNTGWYKLFSFPITAWTNNGVYIEFTVLTNNNSAGVCKGYLSLNLNKATVPAWGSYFYVDGNLDIVAYSDNNVVTVYINIPSEYSSTGLVINSSNREITEYANEKVDAPTGTEIAKKQISKAKDTILYSKYITTDNYTTAFSSAGETSDLLDNIKSYDFIYIEVAGRIWEWVKNPIIIYANSIALGTDNGTRYSAVCGSYNTDKTGVIEFCFPTETSMKITLNSYDIKTNQNGLYIHRVRGINIR